MPEDRLAGVTRLPEPAPTSESEEMYLITVARAVEEGVVGPVPIAVLAKDLQVSVASANEMVRKLAGRNLVTYEPYHGVELTPEGSAVAQRVLRTRRLWATFLADHLGFSPKDADDQACLFEHVTIPEATDRLADFLGDPETGPLGHPIPRRDPKPPQPPAQPLIRLGIGAGGTVAAIDCPAPGRAFLAAEGITVGAEVAVAGTGSHGYLLEVAGNQVNVTGALAAAILVVTRPGA